MRNKFSAIPEPTTDPRSLQNSVLALKDVAEALTGQRPNSSPPVTWDDLVRLGLANAQGGPAVHSVSGSNINGYYTKFTNGLVHCWRNDLTLTREAGFAITATWTLPMPMVANSIVAFLSTSNMGVDFDGVGRSDLGSTRVQLIDQSTIGVGFNSLSGGTSFAPGSKVTNVRVLAIGLSAA